MFPLALLKERVRVSVHVSDKMLQKKMKAIISFWLILLCAPLFCFAQQTMPKHYSQEEMQEMLDAFMKHELHTMHVPGAVVLIIQDGQIAFVKGYGVANLEDRSRMVPTKTYFRMGSITKLVTTTAILQLVE